MIDTQVTDLIEETKSRIKEGQGKIRRGCRGLECQLVSFSEDGICKDSLKDLSDG